MEKLEYAIFDTCLGRILIVCMLPVGLLIYFMFGSLIIGFQELRIAIFGDNELIRGIASIALLFSCIPAGILTMVIFHQAYKFFERLASFRKD